MDLNERDIMRPIQCDMAPCIKAPDAELTASEKADIRLREYDRLRRITIDPSCIDRENSERFILEAIGMIRGCLPYVKRQTEAICLKSVKNEGLSLKDVRQQTVEICLAAIESHKDAFQYVEKYFQTREVCLAGVTKDGRNLKDVLNKTEEICLAALKSHPKAFQYIDTYYQSVADIVQNEEYNKLKAIQ